jgi:SAM-dependent methyltransferase
MTELYTTFADLYHKMYQSFIDYDDEFALYERFVKHAGSKSILEIGCGTGQLAKKFIARGYDYTGIDISSEMLKIAHATQPSGRFLEMDMRNIILQEKFDAILITARSISYLTTNQDVLSAFQSIANVCSEGGKLIFDFIDAGSFIPQINEKNVIEHEAMIDGVRFKRESIYRLQLASSWNWIWESTFLRENNGKFEKIGIDHAELRAFTADELKIFLKLCNFSTNEIIDRKVYAFDTKIVVAGYQSPDS